MTGSAKAKRFSAQACEKCFALEYARNVNFGNRISATLEQEHRRVQRRHCIRRLFYSTVIRLSNLRNAIAGKQNVIHRGE
jgi:hypothetical protein